MNLHHVDVKHDDASYFGRVVQRPGIMTQARTLDELLFMVRDTISLMWNERNVHLEHIVSPRIEGLSHKRRHKSVTLVT